MAESTQIKSFLIESSQQGYGAVNAVVKIESDGSNTIIYQSENLFLHDNYFGGEPFGGREVIFENDHAIWMMVYYGLVTELAPDIETVYSFLKKCLLQPDLILPVRGPKKFTENNWEYKFEYTGDLDKFTGLETIKYQGELVFEGNFFGGIVDRKN